MKKTVLTFGLISGLVLSLMMVITVPFHDQIGFDRSEIVGYATMIAAGLLIYFGIRSYRDNVGGGVVGFGRAFATGMLIVLVSSVLYTATWQVLSTRYAPDFMEKYQEHEIETMRARGATPAQIEARREAGKKYVEWYRNPAIRAAFTLVEPLPVGLVISLVSAAVLSRRRKARES